MSSFKLISFRKGKILDIESGQNANDIKRFANNRPNADRIHAHMLTSNRVPFFISGLRMGKDIAWQKERYTPQTRRLQQFA